MPRPADADLNRAMAEACGYDTETRSGHQWRRGEDGEIDTFAYENGYHNGPVCERCCCCYCEHCSQSPVDAECVPVLPSYCTDRNLLPEVWRAIEQAPDVHHASAIEAWFDAFDELFRDDEGHPVWPSLWHQITAPPRLHVEAALRALGRWREKWDAEEASTHG